MNETSRDRYVIGVAPGQRGLAALELVSSLAGSSDDLLVVIVNESIHSDLLPFADAERTSALFDRARAEWERVAGQAEADARAAAGPRADRLSFAHEEGRPFAALLERGRQARLLALGRRADRLGHTAELLLRRHAGRLLLVPDGTPTVRRVVVGYAGKALGARALALAAELAGSLGVGLAVVTVEADARRREAIQAEARERLSSRGADAELIGADGDVVPSILEAAESDLLVLAPHGRSRLGRWVLGSVAEEVCWRATGPVALAAKRDAADGVGDAP